MRKRLLELSSWIFLNRIAIYHLAVYVSRSGINGRDFEFLTPQRVIEAWIHDDTLTITKVV